MATKPVTFHPDAESEYLTALEWYRERSLTAALDFEAEVSRAIARIDEAPDRWPVYFAVCRRYILHQFPFSVVYRVVASRVIVLATTHGHKRPGYWRKRLRWRAPESGREQ